MQLVVEIAVWNACLYESRKWLYELKMKIAEAKGRGESVWFTIK